MKHEMVIFEGVCSAERQGNERCVDRRLIWIYCEDPENKVFIVSGYELEKYWTIDIAHTYGNHAHSTLTLPRSGSAILLNIAGLTSISVGWQPVPALS
jgi:hypothetical protein